MAKVVHICLCGPVTDGFTYQDNLLPKYHKRLGHNVSVITSKYIWNSNGELDIDSRSIYDNEFGIKTIRLDNKYKTNINSKFKQYKNLKIILELEKPDVLFIHGIQFLDVRNIVKHLKKNPNVTVFVDNHADFSNSATTWLSKNILHKIFWKYQAKLIEPFTKKFYGVLPARVEFLRNVYGLPENKIELLVMGADDDKVQESNNLRLVNSIRTKYGISKDDFLIITGGKIDNSKKQTMTLMKAVRELPNEYVKLIVFGSVIPELKAEFQELVDGNKVQYIGWIKSEESYNYFSTADLVVFPGRHSVLWEQAVGMGIPLIVKYWEGTTHVDVGGNCEFIYEESFDAIYQILSNVIGDKNKYQTMKKVASSNSSQQFLYSSIAKKSIQE